jgi:hypothetical protein
MPLSDEQWRLVVEDILGVRPTECQALVDGIAARHPAVERARALVRALAARAVIAGAPSGLAASLPRALGLAVLEQRAMMRHRATLLASLRYLDDPRFFERHDWARQALGLTARSTGVSVVTNEGVRFGLRLAFVRGARTATRPLGRRVSSLVGAGAGALFNTIELFGFGEVVLEEREATHRCAVAESSPSARVVPLSLHRSSASRGRLHDDDDEETTEGS